MSSLSHHGIKGQRWGVRRFQNKDGTRTALGKKQLKAKRLSRNEEGIRDVYRSLSDEDFRTLGYSKEEADQERKDDFLELGRRHTDYDQYNRVRYKDGKAVGYIAVTGYQTTVGRGKKLVNILAVDLAVHSEYRGNGYSVALGKDLVRWFDTYGSKEYDRMEWYAMSENIGSQKAAERSGFTRRSSKEAAKGWVKYRYDKKQKLKHTSMDDSPYLSHHGIKGQKWGVRRFQNKDGTRTALGKHRDFERTASKVVEDLSNSPHPFVKRPIDKDEIRQRGLITQAEADQCASLATSVFKQASQAEPQITGDVIGVVSSTSAKMYGLNNRLKQPTSIAAKIGADAKADGITFEEAAGGLKDAIRYTAVSDSRDYVNTYNAIKHQLEEKGYAEVKCKNYFQKYQNGEVMHKAVQSTFRSPDGVEFEFQFQTPESQAAKELKVPIYNERRKAGNTPERNAELEQEMRNLAEQVPDPEGVFEIKSHSGIINSNKLKHTSIGGTMYIEGNALILGDSSYLEHHGIKGQRWGVRRFQNEDGSLTNAGRKRLGYVTKGATQTVKKAFKAGIKTGTKAVKAVKAHHEKAEAKKIEKKKEKASQSRLGVLANKDLFTDDELRALNQRFKVEDELKMASIQKGVEIAKAVGTIASNAATAAKAYEDITGQSLSPIKRQAAELKKQQDAEDRARKIASEDAEEARKAAQEERNIKKFDQELRKATADADKEEFLAKKTKAQADQEILKALKGARDFDKPDDDDNDPPKPPNGGGGGNSPGGGSDDGSSWVQKATAGGKNPFEKMIYDNDPEYKAAKDAHDEKVARKERMEYLDKHIAEREQEKQAEKAAKDKALMDMINQSNARTGRGQSTPPKESQTETPEPTKTPRQDSDALFSQKGSLPIDKGRYKNSRAASRAKQFKDDVEEERTKKQDDKAVKAAIDTIIKDYQRQDDTVRNLNPSGYDRQVALSVIKSKAKNTVDKVKHPVDTVAKKISDKAREEKWAKERAKLYKEYQDDREKLGPEFANETYLRAKRQSLQNLGYRGEALEKKLNENSFSKKKKAKHDAFSIQNGVLFIDESVSLSHHGIKGQRWGIRRFQNPDGTLTPAGKKREARQAEKKAKKEAKFHTKAENLRAKDLARYDKMLSKNLTSQDRLNYTELKKYTEKASDKEVLAGSSHAKRAAIGAGIVGTIGLSISGVPNVASIPMGIAIAKAINNQERDNVRIRTINAQNRRKYAEDKTREVASYVEHSALVASISDGLYLEHHGILGQKWGVRRFQDTAGRLTAAGKARLKDAKSSIDSLRPRDKKTTNSNKKVQRRGTGEEEMVASGGASWEELDEEEYAAYLEWFKSLSDEELKQLGIKRSEIDAIKSKDDLYALIQKYRQKKTYNTGTAKLINGTLNALFSSNLLSVFDPAVVMGSAATAELRKKLAEHRKSKEPIDPKSGFHVKSDANASKIDDMKNVNPGFTDLSDNTKNNCMLCTTTYDLRRRGYDVTAEEVRAGYYTGDVKRWYPDAEIHKVKNYSTVDELIDNTEKAISKQGDGARGNIIVTWQQGGGHSMAYEVENGKVVIYDCQTGTRYENAGDILKYTNTVSYARLDNVEPDYDKIKEASN